MGFENIVDREESGEIGREIFFVMVSGASGILATYIGDQEAATKHASRIGGVAIKLQGVEVLY
jgi:hypothetical protein